MNRRETTALTVQLSQPLSDRILALSASTKVSLDSIAEEALLLWAAREEKIHQMTLEGLDDVDAGRVVDHSAMQAWVESLATDQPLPMP